MAINSNPDHPDWETERVIHDSVLQGLSIHQVPDFDRDFVLYPEIEFPLPTYRCHGVQCPLCDVRQSIPNISVEPTQSSRTTTTVDSPTTSTSEAARSLERRKTAQQFRKRHQASRNMHKRKLDQRLAMDMSQMSLDSTRVHGQTAPERPVVPSLEAPELDPLEAKVDAAVEKEPVDSKCWKMEGEMVCAAPGLKDSYCGAECLW